MKPFSFSVALGILMLGHRGFAQTFQHGFSYGSSQGTSRSSNASQSASQSIKPSKLVLENTQQQPNRKTYRIIDPNTPFRIRESRQSTQTTSDTNSNSFSSFAGVNTSVFHTPTNR